MTYAYRAIQRLNSSHVEMDLPNTFVKGHEIEIIVLPLEISNIPSEQQRMNEWLAEVWGCAPDFPDRPPQPPIDEQIITNIVVVYTFSAIISITCKWLIVSLANSMNP